MHFWTKTLTIILVLAFLTTGLGLGAALLSTSVVQFSMSIATSSEEPPPPELPDEQGSSGTGGGGDASIPLDEEGEPSEPDEPDSPEQPIPEEPVIPDEQPPDTDEPPIDEEEEVADGSGGGAVTPPEAQYEQPNLSFVPKPGKTEPATPQVEVSPIIEEVEDFSGGFLVEQIQVKERNALCMDLNILKISWDKLGWQERLVDWLTKAWAWLLALSFG